MFQSKKNTSSSFRSRLDSLVRQLDTILGLVTVFVTTILATLRFVCHFWQCFGGIRIFVLCNQKELVLCAIHLQYFQWLFSKPLSSQRQ